MTKTWLGCGLFMTVVAAGCSGASPPMVGPAGDGGDAIVTPLCNGTSMTGTAGFSGNGGPNVGGGFSEFPPNFGTTVTQSVAPPAISGGTLRILADGKTAIAADPDRDRVYVVDLPSRTVSFSVALAPGDEPGRVVTDAAGRAHVALRHGGALVTIDPATGAIAARRNVCASPRGLAYDPANDVVHVACSDGQLVSFPAAGGSAIRTLQLPRDLRDVAVDGPHLRISRFRSADVLTVEADGTVSDEIVMPGFRAEAARGGELYTAAVAYKMEEMPNGGGVMVLHQRGLTDPVQPVAGGYGGPDTCGAIVHPAVSSVSTNGSVKSGPAIAGMVLAVDMAISHDGKRIAFVSAGNATNMVPGDVGPDLPRVFATSVDAVTDDTVGCMPDGTHAPCPGGFGSSGLGMTGGGGRSSTPPPPAPDPDTGTAGSGGATGMGTGSGGTTGTGTGTGSGFAGDVGTTNNPPTAVVCGGMPDPSVPNVVAMQPTAVAFDGSDNIVVQSREPALLVLKGGVTITLSTVSRSDTGHSVFHANSGGFLACASCHAEGNDDGRIWNFTCEGKRRTQSLQTGLAGTEPFHWSGDETNFAKLMTDVFVGRMSGPMLGPDQETALFSWIDAQPRPARTAAPDPDAVARGDALFHDTTHAACSSCHAGAKFTNAQTVDVGTGGAFQVPSLVGIGTRGPFMHNGCAQTLADRFSDASCGGGDHHGVTSTMSASQISDLIAYLNTI
jgi:hypothetical protein